MTTPAEDNWRDHATPCPNCDEPVLSKYEHLVDATMADLYWWKCDPDGEEIAKHRRKVAEENDE